MDSMTVLDIIIIIIFVAAAVLGFRKGFVTQIGSFAAIVIAVLVCRMSGGQVAELIMPSSAEPHDASPLPHYIYMVVAYCIVYLAAYYVVTIVVKLLKFVVHTVFLGPLDRIGGALVSVVKWFIPVSLALNLYIAVFPDSNLADKSHLCGGQPVTWIVELAPRVLGALTSFNSSFD